MEGESSKDFGASHKEGEDSKEDKPIMRLFKNLISSECKENTVLTNGQIIELLEKDFQIDTSKLHELELEIYLHIIKRFLKEWPQWDEFDVKLQYLKDKVKLHKYLLVKYDELKHYLTIMLDTARPRAKERVKQVQDKFKEQTESKSPVDGDMSDVILDIQCSRDQLNQLFYSRPHPEKNNTIFNILTSEPNRIHVNNPSYNAILNWWNVAIVLTYPSFHIIRSTTHESTFTLVNKKLRLKQKISELNQYFQEKSMNYSPNISKTNSKQSLITLPEVIKNVEDGIREIGHMDTFRPIFETFAKDLKKFPADDSHKDMIWYRKYLAKYPYKRYLCSEVETTEASSKFDLKLKETISPMYQIQVLELEPYLTQKKTLKDVKLLGYEGITLECQSCSLNYSGLNALQELKQHVLDHHFNEPDWQCMKCKQTFTMVFLTEHRWRHICNRD